MQVKTVTCKLRVNEESSSALAATMLLFNTVCNRLSAMAWETRTFRQFDLHKIAYHPLRSEYGLPAQLTVRAIAKVCDSYKTDRSVQHAFGPQGAVVYDVRCFKMHGVSAASLTTINGRFRFSLAHGGKQRAQLEAGTTGEADLLFRDGNYYLAITIKSPDPTPADTSGGTLGVDLGIINLATDSEGTCYSGTPIKVRRKKTERLVQLLQKKGTKNAKRRLKKISGRRSRYRRDINHCISKTIVQTAMLRKKALALEDLTGIGQRASTGWNRSELGKWSFADLGTKIRYKAAEVGIPVAFVDPRNTSRTCSKCGNCEKANRKSQSQFLCRKCGWENNADFNAALNIAARADLSGSLLSQPEFPWNGIRSGLGTSHAILMAVVT